MEGHSFCSVSSVVHTHRLLQPYVIYFNFPVQVDICKCERDIGGFLVGGKWYSRRASVPIVAHRFDFPTVCILLVITAPALVNAESSTARIFATSFLRKLRCQAGKLPYITLCAATRFEISIGGVGPFPCCSALSRICT